MYYTSWHIERKSSFPMIKVIGESDQKEAELGLVSVAILLIKKAEYFEGIPCQENPIYPKLEPGSKISISFSILFKDENGFIEFAKAFEDNEIF